MRFLSRFKRDESAATTAELSLLTTLIIVCTMGLVELTTSFLQYHEAQKAARIGARIAASNDPVAADLYSITGIDKDTKAGDPLPYYERVCSGKDKSCVGGSYDDAAMRRILFGTNGDDKCADVNSNFMGMCDVQREIRAEHVTITYQNSGLDIAGNPPQLAPLITVRVSGLEFDLNLLNGLLPTKLKKMPDIEVTVMAEDLRSDA